MKTETRVTGFAQALNRWHDTFGALHAQHDIALPNGTLQNATLCGVHNRRPMAGDVGYSPNAMCATCAKGMFNRIRAGMVRAFFATAWADEVERNGGSLSGLEITDVMPKRADPEAFNAADSLIAKMGGPDTVCSIYATNRQGYEGGKLITLSLETWGHYCAMDAMGHGVGLADYGIGYDAPWEEQPQLSRLYSFKRK